MTLDIIYGMIAMAESYIVLAIPLPSLARIELHTIQMAIRTISIIRTPIVTATIAIMDTDSRYGHSIVRRV